MAHTRRLDAIEERICGALMEKEQTTPDSYPLTVKALVNACNQKSNREPVTDFSEAEVRDALEQLRKDVLVWRSTGARVDRWEHRLQSRWHLDPSGLALITLLMLRGAQTPGELRARSERMHAFASTDEVEAVLQRLSAGENALVRELPRQPGQRENRWVHLMARDPTGETASASAGPQADGRPSETSAGVGGGSQVQQPPVGGLAASTSVASSEAAHPEPQTETEHSHGQATATSAVAKAALEPDRLRQLEKRVAQLEERLASLEAQLGVD